MTFLWIESENSPAFRQDYLLLMRAANEKPAGQAADETLHL
jgi:hypothetical protein